MFVVLAGLASPARAAPPYVDRGLTLPEHDWSFDIGFGITHEGSLPNPLTGPGFNFEFAVSPVENLELGFRDGARFGDDARALHADEAGRLFDRETFGSYGANGILSNPEFRIRGRVVHARVVEVAIEGRLYPPIEDNSRVAVEIGVPLLFHLGNKARIDTGVYTPIVFFDRAYYAFDFPIDVWFQVTPKVWLGPIGGFRYEHQDFPPPVRPLDHTFGSLGFGFGYQLARNVDMKAWLLSPHITDNRGIDDFELGFGFQFRIE
jgi:hypothetical protein